MKDMRWTAASANKHERQQAYELQERAQALGGLVGQPTLFLRTIHSTGSGWVELEAAYLEVLLDRIEKLEGGLREMRRVIVDTMGDDEDILDLWIPFIDQRLEAGVGS